MIGRKNRFHGHNSVSKVRGPSFHSENLSLKAAKNRRSNYRLAVVVSKKVDNRAVVRNRIRRRIFELIRTKGRLNSINIDVVVYVKTDKVANMPTSDLEKELTVLVKKALQKLH